MAHTKEEVYAVADASCVQDAINRMQNVHPKDNKIETAVLAQSMYHNRLHYLKMAAKFRKQEAEEQHQITIKTAAMKKTTPATGDNNKLPDGDLETILVKIYNQFVLNETLMKDLCKIQADMLQLFKDNLSKKAE